MLDFDALVDFVVGNSINAVNLCYALYEMKPSLREQVLNALRSALKPPGLILVIEPHGELTRSGCVVELYDHERPRARKILEISDGHFVGNATAARDYAWFVDNYPISYHSRPGRTAVR
ncbi:hypothetical protein ACWELJ_00275 [Nocardia sp. NPDC004582]